MPEEFKTAQNLRRQIRDVAQYRATVQNLGDHADSTFVTPRQVRRLHPLTKERIERRVIRTIISRLLYSSLPGAHTTLILIKRK
jgi:hypothetical protein